MENITRQNNEFTLIFLHNRINCTSSQNGRFNKIINQASITTTRNSNRISVYFDTEESAGELLLNNGFLLIVKGDNNIVDMGTIILRYSTILGMTGLKLIVGQLLRLGAGVSKTASNYRVDIGNRVIINGATLCLQEDGPYASIGDDNRLSQGIDIWCTNAHTIIDLRDEPINFAKCIEVGKHVWIGKNGKIGKGVKITNNSIVGWRSIVAKGLNGPNVIVAGIPAKIVRRGINRDWRCISKYLEEGLQEGSSNRIYETQILLELPSYAAMILFIS